METKQPQLVMRTRLYGLPVLRLPEKYTARGFQPGDESAWEEIVNDSFNISSSFQKDIGQQEPFSPERVRFVCYEGRPAATATAWYNHQWAQDTGYLHMVGAHSAFTGNGIGLLVCLDALHQMAAEGRTYAVLHTDDFRIPAIVTYLKLGFRPVPVHENHPDRWKEIAGQIHSKTLSEVIMNSLKN